MVEPTPGFGGDLPPAVMARIDEVCDRFAAAWKAGAAPRIEDELAGAREAIRPRLFRELLALELDLRNRRGDCLALLEYRNRFPDRADTVAAAFAALPPVSREAHAGSRRDPGSDLTLSYVEI